MSSTAERAAPTIAHALAERARAMPHAPAFLASGRPALSYSALADHIAASVATLNRLGYGRDDRIAVVLPPGSEGPVALIAVMTGCVAVPLNPVGAVSEFQALFARLRIAAVLTQPAVCTEAVHAAVALGIAVVELMPDTTSEAGRFRLRGEPRGGAPRTGDASPIDLAAIFTTSGTTSVPKVIPLTHEVIWLRATRAQRIIELSPRDRCLDLMPSFHGDAAFNSILGTVFAGASSFCPDSAVTDFWRWTNEARPTWCALPTPYVEMLTRAPAGGAMNPEMRAIFTCGAPVSIDTVTAFEERFGVPLQNLYGATECGSITAQPLAPAVRKRGSVGRTLGLDLVIVDEELLVRGPGIFSSYEGAPEATAAAFSGEWYRTGDLAYLDADNFLFLTGRVTDLINRGGEKISPSEIEAVLRRHPAIIDAAAFPVPHHTLGQDLAAAVVVRDGEGASAADIRAFAATHLAPFKVPRAVVPVSAIPTASTGKVARAALAATLAGELTRAAEAGAADAPRSATEERLARIWSTVLHTDRIGVQQSFTELGGDSLTAVHMLLQVQREFGVQTWLDELWRWPTIAGFAAYLDTAPPASRARSLLVTLQPAVNGTSRPPLFWVLPGWYLGDNARLSRHLGADQPFHALIPDPRPAGAERRLSAGAIVTASVAAMREQQPHGPYRIGGGSAGGLAAVAIARRLLEEGERVALLALADTYYPGYPLRNAVPAPLRQLLEHTGALASMKRSEWLGYFLRHTGGRLRRELRARTGLGPTRQQAAEDMLSNRLNEVFGDEPRPYGGSIVMFAAEQSPRHGFLDGRLHWSKVAEGGLEVQLVSGNHLTMAKDPHVAVFAAELRKRLDRVIDFS